MLDLAKRPNAVIKVSGACTLSREPYPFPDIWDPLARVFDAWGFDRCLWGTDWTRAFAVVNYEQAVEPFLQDRPPERQRTGHADGRRLRQGLWLVAEERLKRVPKCDALERGLLHPSPERGVNILCWGNLPFRQTDRLIDTQRTMLLLQRPGMQQA